MNNKDFIDKHFLEIENIKKKFNINENDPLFAFIEIQINILKEIQKSNDISTLSHQTQDLINLFDKMKNEFDFLSFQKKNQLEKDIHFFIEEIKNIVKNDLTDFKHELKNKYLLEEKKFNLKPTLNFLSISINIIFISTFIYLFI